MKLPYVVAEILVRAAEVEAAAIGVPMAIAVVDSEGGLQLFKRMDGTLPVSTELAQAKAYTAAAIRIPTDVVGKLAQPGEALYGIQHTHQGRIVLFGGGMPLFLQGQIVGAVGVSGGLVEQDMQVAQSAIDKLVEIELWTQKVQSSLANQGEVEPLALGRIKDELVRAFAHAGPDVSEDAIAVVSGAVVLALA